ncbi:Uncharacterised protein [Burkholderia pseudomallei]|nr:Uncharacterised protein [Burkholderia pseudomallei]CAJ6836618.1 Uncharacterised protein [Burkholderia pseudomallei]CAJ9333844.1 Uncharacterised protein [Burkholderia pseudomallei]CAJ9988110.1 Uncharacterised protein [Burkholderia pseudomallei]
MDTQSPTAKVVDIVKPTLTRAGFSLAAMLAARTALSATPLGVPISLFVAAASYSPAIVQLFSKSKDELPKELENELEARGKEDIEAFMRNHAWSVQMADDAGLSFPPGHPRIGTAYRQHPLASVTSAKKAHVYIPAEQYEAILLQEREAELIRLLVHLGATKISISKKRRTSTASKRAATLTASASFASGDVTVDKTDTNTVDEDQVRIFELTGKSWQHGDTLDRTHFAWASFEPSWDALIVAREIGGCLQADLEVRERTTFSSDWRITAALMTKQVFNGNAAVSASDSDDEEHAFFVRATFGRPVRRADTCTAMPVASGPTDTLQVTETTA